MSDEPRQRADVMITKSTKNESDRHDDGNNKPLKQSRRGSALVFVVLAMTLLLVAGTSILALGFGSRVIEARDTQTILAHNAADAGFADAMVKVNQSLAAGTWNDSSLPATTSNVTLPGSANQSYSYMVTKDSNGVYNISATGYCGNIQRTVKATLNGSSGSGYGLFSSSGFSLINNSLIDAYDSRLGSYGAGNSGKNTVVGTLTTASGGVSMVNGCRIVGNLEIGNGGNPANVVSLVNSSTISGSQTAFGSNPTFADPVVPSTSVLPNKAAISSSKTLTATDSGTYPSISLVNSQNLTIAGNVTMHVTGNISLTNSCQIIINNGCSLTLYLDGNLTPVNLSAINNLTKDPTKLTLYGSPGGTISLVNGADFYGSIYAPKATVSAVNSVNVYGSIICKSSSFVNTLVLHYDMALASNSTISFFSVKRWSE
jgi:hypothetical protein